jgi:hypothetical protein
MKPLILLTIFLILGSLAKAQKPATASAQNVVVVRIINPPKISIPLNVQESPVIKEQGKWQITRTEEALLTPLENSITFSYITPVPHRNTMKVNDKEQRKIIIYTHSES